MNRYKLVHVTQFSYDGPVTESYNDLRLRPRHDESQSCLSFRLTTRPDSKPSAHQDFFGNWVHQFHILQEHRSLRVESEAVVLVHPVTRPAPAEQCPLLPADELRATFEDEHYDWMLPSQYCPLAPELTALVEEAELRAEPTIRGFAESASNLVHERFKYQPGATHVFSSAADVLAEKAGVCQDFSHVLIAMLRARGLAARYVSGYLVPRQTGAQAAMERVIGGLASHAWVQVYIPEIGWTGLDPTVGSFVEAQHIRLAYGRDYGDVPPVRGVYKGHAGQSLSVDVLVRPALDDEGALVMQESAAVPPPRDEREPQQQQQQQQ